MANSSPFFRNLLASQRTTFLFEKVLEILATSIWKNEGLKRFPVSHILNLRAVCSHWNAVIDKWIPEKLQQLKKGSVDNNLGEVKSALISIVDDGPVFNYTIEDEEINIVQTFLRHFEVTHGSPHSKARNPLIWGDITVLIECTDEAQDEEYLQYLEGMFTLLSKYGSHLHTIEFNIYSTELLDIVSILQKWLVLMPNLTEINLNENTNLSNENELNLGNPFPNLKQLKSLTACGVPAIVLNELIRQNDQISTLSIGRWKVSYNVFTLPLPNLKKLNLGCCSANIIKLLGSQQIQWQLESLKIQFKNNANINWTTFLQVIQEKFAKTLVSLKFGFNNFGQDAPKSRTLKTFKNCRLVLPNLRKIELGMGDNLICLDFLLPMKKHLEKITVNIFYKFPLTQKITGRSGTIVQFTGFEEKMLESNVWVIFKMLKEFRIKWNLDRLSKYTREEWMESNVYT